MNLKWPFGKDFAFSIIDDTDDATLQNTKPIYDYLYEKSFSITKTVWIYPTRNNIPGISIQNEAYLKYIKELQQKDFEIQLHNVGSGKFSREEILDGLEIFKNEFNSFPSMQINHARNPDNIYWDHKRYSPLLSPFVKLSKGNQQLYFGEIEQSKFFWGDRIKKHIKYIRNRDFYGINTLKYDPKMPYREKFKNKYSNFWFSCSNGGNLSLFNQLTSKKNIDKLKQEKGCCIIYSHLGDKFVDSPGDINPAFKENMDYLANQNGWFVPVSTILDHLLTQKTDEFASNLYLTLLDIKWLKDRLLHKVKKLKNHK